MKAVVYNATLSLGEDDLTKLYHLKGDYPFLQSRVRSVFDLGLKVAANANRKRVKSELISLRKADLIELLLHCYDEGKVSLCTLEMPSTPPSTPSADIQRLSSLLEAYKRKVDELLPAGEVFVPDIPPR